MIIKEKVKKVIEENPNIRFGKTGFTTKFSKYNPLQRFLKQFKLKLTAKHFVNINVSEKDGFYLYNYNDLVLVPRNDPIIRMCRGLVLDISGKVMNYPFNRFFNYHEVEHDDVDWSTAEIQEKLDGCVSGDTRINMFDGSTRNIKSIFGNRSNWLNRELLGLDEKTGKIVKTKVLGVTHRKLGKDWNKIKLSNGKEIKCTKDHKIMTQNGWKESHCLTKEDKILSYELDLVGNARQILIGTLIGDASIKLNGANYKVTFGQKEEEYTEWKSRIFDKIGGFRDTRISGFGTEVHRFSSHNHSIFKKYRNLVWKNGERILSRAVKELNYLGLAVWIMDDGHRSHNNFQRDRIGIDVSRYKLEDIEESLKILKENLDLNASVLKYKNKYYRIMFDTESSQKIFKNISKYVPNCMNRKLPKEIMPTGDNLTIDPNLKFEKKWVNLLDLLIIENEEIHYDIQTTTGNFFAEEILIHNSLISVWFDGCNWRVTTRGAFYPTLNGGVDFEQVFKRLFTSFDKLTHGFSYMFEMCSSENPIVTRYDEEFVTLIGIRDLDNYCEISQNVLDVTAELLGVRRPKRFKATDIDSCRALFAQLKEDDEGFVVVDRNFNRFKLKQESYLKMARIMSLKDQDILDYVLGKSQIDADFDKMPEVKEKIDKVTNRYQEFLGDVLGLYGGLESIEEQKEFALEALKYPFSSVLFHLRKGRPIEEYNLKYEQLERWTE